MTDSDDSKSLTVKGESIERIYSQYEQEKFVVNRRYQRKLIWTLEEKKAFIDSIVKGYPVPIILLAENQKKQSYGLEIIDGMQRLNAVISFIENDYMIAGKYFDLNTMTTTKQKFDEQSLEQREPVLDRDACVDIAAYLLPISIYEFSDSSRVDDVFRRINSGGRKLSRQELRAAGATGHFADVVRKLAAKVRGDDSHKDTLRLNDMKRISITNKDLDYGIIVDDLFWVKQGILTKEQVRESRDEELVADIVAYMVSDEPLSSRSEFLDDYFGLNDDESSMNRYSELEAAVQRRTEPLVISDFNRTLDTIRLVLDSADQTFGQLLFGEQPPRAPR